VLVSYTRGMVKKMTCHC